MPCAFQPNGTHFTLQMAILFSIVFFFLWLGLRLVGRCRYLRWLTRSHRTNSSYTLTRATNDNRRRLRQKSIQSETTTTTKRTRRRRWRRRWQWQRQSNTFQAILFTSSSLRICFILVDSFACLFVGFSSRLSVAVRLKWARTNGHCVRACICSSVCILRFHTNHFAGAMNVPSQVYPKHTESACAHASLQHTKRTRISHSEAISASASFSSFCCCSWPSQKNRKENILLTDSLCILLIRPNKSIRTDLWNNRHRQIHFENWFLISSLSDIRSTFSSKCRKPSRRTIDSMKCAEEGNEWSRMQCTVWCAACNWAPLSDDIVRMSAHTGERETWCEMAKDWKQIAG